MRERLITTMRSLSTTLWCFILVVGTAVLAISCEHKVAQKLHSKTGKPVPVEINVAAASSLRFAMPEIIEAYLKEHPGDKVTPTYGASGNFFAQIQSKAPFDVFLSADETFPQRLIDEGHAVKGTVVRYASGRVVMWTPNGSGVNIQQGYPALGAADVKKIAIANPKVAPYGVAAEQAMKKAGVWDAAQPRIVMGESVAQAAQFAESGAAQVAFVAMSLAASPEMKDKGTYWVVPADDHAPILQAGVVTIQAKDQEGAARFLRYLLTDSVRQIMERHGFDIPSDE